MNKKAVSGIVLMLLLTSMLSSAFIIQPVEAEPTTIIVPDDYPTIQDAINAANSGDTIYVRAGTYYENIVVGKTLSIMGENRKNTFVDGAFVDTVIHVTANNVVIKGFTLQNCGYVAMGAGIILLSSNNTISGNDFRDNEVGVIARSNNNTISGNNVTNNYIGVILDWSSFNIVSRNNVANSHSGINLYASGNNSIYGNNITGSTRMGISLTHYSSYNSIFGNNITANGDTGAWLYESSNNTLIGNNITANNYAGIACDWGSQNSISGNTIKNNYIGISLSGASNNKIYHNKFTDNTNQASSSDPNFWDDSYPSGGNYWSDYTDVDLYSGPYQNETGSDDIWDHPYVIDSDNQDRFPLVNPWRERLESPWPMFRHDPRHTGFSRSPAPNVNTTLWVFNATERVGSSPAVADGKIFIVSWYDGKVHAIDQLNGTLIWRSQLEGHTTFGSPAIYNNKLFITDRNKTYALNAETGAIVWRTLTGGLSDFSSPNIADGMVFVASYEGVYCLNATTGMLIWRYPEIVYSSLALADGVVFFASSPHVDASRKIFALDQFTGELVWSRDIEDGMEGSFLSSPAVGGGKVFVGLLETTTWTGIVYALDAYTGSIVWRSMKVGAVWSSPAVAYGKVFVGSGDGKIYAFNEADGNLIWNYATGDTIVSSPAVADGKVFIGSDDKCLYAFDERNGALLWKYKTRHWLESSPAVADGSVYVGSLDGKLYAFGPTLPAPDFSITSSPPSLTVQQGDADTSEITVTSINGFDQQVQLSVSIIPPGVTGTLVPDTVTPPPDGSITSTLIVAVDTTATPGSYTLTVTGTNGTITHSVQIPLEVTIPPNEPPTCSIKLQKEGVEIDEVDVSEFFDIYVGDSTDDTGIEQVRFSSDDEQDNHPTGEWAQWYDWDFSSGDWNASTKIKRWSFTTPGYKEVWAEVKDDINQTDKRLARIYVPGTQPPTCVIELQKDGFEIDDVDVRQPFDIYVGGSTDDAAIEQVMFSSDDSQDGTPTGEWTEWYDWDGWGEDWDPVDKIKRWSFDTAGNKEVWAMIEDSDGNVVWNHANIFVHPGYAIIVAGSAAPGTKRTLDHSANNAYRVLRNLGFDDNHIFYLNSEEQDVDGDGRKDEVDAPALLSYFTNAINEVRDKIGDSSTPFIIYLVGHGVPDAFIFHENAGEEGFLYVYTPPAGTEGLQEMLDKFSNQVPMLIMVNSCFSGCFIASTEESPGTVSSANRIIITSAHDDQERLAFTWIRFSDRFWGYLDEGLNVREAFTRRATWGDNSHSWLDDNGDARGHPPNDLEDDGELASATHIGVVDAENLGLEAWQFGWKRSPGELRVYDLQNRVTGLVNGEVKEEIPDSIYDEENEIVAIFSPSDTYHYEVVGTEEESYGLEIASINGSEAVTFNATDIPTSTNATHQYTVDWDALSQGEEGVTLQIDFDGDGVFEQTITVDSELTHDEFALQTATTIDFDPDTLNLGSEGIWVTVYIELPAGYNMSQIDVSSIVLNGTVPALTKPIEIGDYDGDGIPDLMVKFDRAEVIALLSVGEAALTMTGEVSGIPFEGNDTIRVIDK